MFKKAKNGVVSGLGKAYDSAEHSVVAALIRRHPDIDEIFNILSSIKEEQERVRRISFSAEMFSD
jgi:aconitase B